MKVIYRPQFVNRCKNKPILHNFVTICSNFISAVCLIYETVMGIKLLIFSW